MKKLLFTIAIVSLLVACKNKSAMDTNKDMVPLTDAYKNNTMADTARILQNYTLTNGGTVTPKAAGTNNVTRSSNTANRVNTSTSTGNNTASTAAVNKKKGWSKAAKGATIGGVGGAVAGAVIGKNAKGAVIGGVIGAAGGYIIGRSKDKKDGRVQ
jgi:hypothetical protein